MTDDTRPHAGNLTNRRPATFDEDDGSRGDPHRSSGSTRSIEPKCSRLLRRRLGADRADDAFQETFLRALRAYGRLDHGEHLRAWVLTIAQNVALDTLRRTRSDRRARRDGRDDDQRPPMRSSRSSRTGSGPKERAAVVLRYGYDLSYDQIASVLGSSPRPPARRRPRASDASEGGSRHDRRHQTSTAVSATPPRRSSLIDVGFDVVDTPIGELLVAASDRGSAAICSTRTDEDGRAARAHRRAARPSLAAQRRRRPTRARRVLRGPSPRRSTHTRPRGRFRHSPSRFSTSSRASRTVRRRRTVRSRSASATRARRAPWDGDEPQPRSRSSSRATASSARTATSPATPAGSTASARCSSSRAPADRHSSIRISDAIVRVGLYASRARRLYPRPRRRSRRLPRGSTGESRLRVALSVFGSMRHTARSSGTVAQTAPAPAAMPVTPEAAIAVTGNES